MEDTVFQLKFEERSNGTIHLSTPEQMNLLIAARKFISRVKWGENLDETSLNDGIEIEGQIANRFVNLDAGLKRGFGAFFLSRGKSCTPIRDTPSDTICPGKNFPNKLSPI